MLRSMTAFAKAKKSYSDVEIAVEIQSVNKKHLDLHVKLPPECMLYDPLVREVLSQHVERGHIYVSVQVQFLSAFSVNVVANTSYAKSLHRAALKLADELEVKVDNDKLFFTILREKGVLQASFEVQSDDFEEKLRETLSAACHDFVQMKEREGLQIANEFFMRLDALSAMRGQIELLSKDAKPKFYKRINELVEELVGKAADGDERIAKEIALMADKVDISEELSRFGFHLEHFRNEMKAKKSGKVLEFILQELSREINTMGAKCQDAHVSRLVIDAKSELEKLREQVANVE
ncbi:MAG: YicC family protein [Verrucomicrobia bacterium]|nr:YicC family protein [Verrucomicrobiota bacterium]